MVRRFIESNTFYKNDYERDYKVIPDLEDLDIRDGDVVAFDLEHTTNLELTDQGPS